MKRSSVTTTNHFSYFLICQITKSKSPIGNNIIAHLIFLPTYPTLTRLYHTYHTFCKSTTSTRFIQTFKQQF